MKAAKTVAAAMAAMSVCAMCAALDASGVPDSSDIRKSMVESWFEAPLEALREMHPEIRKNKSGERFQARMEESGGAFTILVAPSAQMQVDVYSEEGKTTVTQEVYPGDAKGAWLLARDKASGDPLWIRYRFASDSDVYLQFRPVNGTAAADLVVFGHYAAKGAPTGVPFQRMYGVALEDAVELTQGSLPWRCVECDPGMYHCVKRMAAVIAKRLPDLSYAEDAMYDENGDPVCISTGKRREGAATGEGGKLSLSSAGFIKWIADGIVFPAAGSALRREPLIRPTVSFSGAGLRGNISQSYDITFALDWTRNTAAAILSARSRRDYLYEDSGVDVAEEPFAAVETARGLESDTGRVKDSGYRARSLKALMYVMAARYPGEFYLAAIKETNRKVSPEVSAFNQCAAIMPYFSADGRFQCVVFRNGAQTTLDEFCSRFKDCFVNLSRVKATDDFQPM